jgi:hypothetical protein
LIKTLNCPASDTTLSSILELEFEMAVYSNYLNALPHYSRAPEMNKITLPLLLKRHHLVLRSTILGLRSSLPRLDLPATSPTVVRVLVGSA